MKPKYVLRAVIFIVLLNVSAVWGAPPFQTQGTPITIENAAQIAQAAVMEGHTGPVFSLAFSPDGAMLVSGGSGQDYTAHLWDVAAASEKAVLEGHTAQIAAVAFNTDGTTALSASYDHTVKLWKADTGELVETQEGNPETGVLLDVQNLSTHFSADGTKLAYSTDMGTGPYIWDVVAKTQVDLSADIADLSGTVGSIAFSADGKLTATQQMEGPIRIIDVETAQEVIALETPDTLLYISAMTFSPDGKLLAVADADTSTIQLWNVETGEAEALLSGHAPNTDGTLGVYGLAFNPDGSLLVSASYDKTVRVWDVAAGTELATLESDGDGPASAAWSPDGTRFATGDLNGSILLWGVPGA